MSLCIWFVDENNGIREEFVENVQIQEITGKHPTTTILDILNRKHIPFGKHEWSVL